MPTWPLIALMGMVSATYGLLTWTTERPFYLDIDNYKGAQFQWLYAIFGRELAGLIFFSVAAALFYLSFSEWTSRTSLPDAEIDSEYARLVLAIFAVLLLGVLPLI